MCSVGHQACQITKAFPLYNLVIIYLRTTLQIKEIRHKNLLHAESPCKVIVKIAIFGSGNRGGKHLA